MTPRSPSYRERKRLGAGGPDGAARNAAAATGQSGAERGGAGVALGRICDDDGGEGGVEGGRLSSSAPGAGSGRPASPP